MQHRSNEKANDRLIDLSDLFCYFIDENDDDISSMTRKE